MDSSSQGAFVAGTGFVVVTLHMQEESEFVQGFGKGEMGEHKRLFADRERTKKHRSCLCRPSLVSIEHCQRIQVVSSGGMERTKVLFVDGKRAQGQRFSLCHLPLLLIQCCQTAQAVSVGGMRLPEMLLANNQSALIEPLRRLKVAFVALKHGQMG